MARRIEAATGVETRATILGHMQRGGSLPARTGYMLRSWVQRQELLAQGTSNRLVAYKDGKFVDFDIQEALQMKKDILEDQVHHRKKMIN